MANPVVQAAMCACPFGAAPAVLTVTSQQTVTICKMPAATIQDGMIPNLPPCGLCIKPAKPAVAAATAAAMGVLTPAPCVPVTISWVPGCPTVTVCGRPLLNNTSCLACAYGGVIQVSATPAMTVKTP